MAGAYGDDGYIEDSEEEDIMQRPRSPMGNPVGGEPRPLPQSPEAGVIQDQTVSSIQTSFSTEPLSIQWSPQRPLQDAVASSIRNFSLTVDQSVVSDISSFGPSSRHSTGATTSIQTSDNRTNPTEISTFSSASTPAIVKAKPRPRPVFKRKGPTDGDSSLTDASPSVRPADSDTSFPSFHPMLPPPLPVPPPPPAASTSRSSPSTATTEPATPRTSENGSETMDIEMMDIAERAKMRSRVRPQPKGKQVISIDDDVIELSSDDELSFISKSKRKPKPKPKGTAASKSASEKAKGKGKETQKKKNGKAKDPSKPPPRKRSRLSQGPELELDSDVHTVPVPTSDFPIPHLSSQLPPSDPPPPPSTLGSSVPQMSQELGAPDLRDDSPLSSPPPPPPRKRKRPQVSVLDSDSELVADQNLPLLEHTSKMKNKAPKDTPLPEPSSHVVPETQPVVMPKAQSRRKRPVADEDDWDDPSENVTASSSTSRKRIRVNDDDDDDWAGGRSKKTVAKKTVRKEKIVKEKSAKSKVTPKEKTPKSKATPKEKTPKSKEVIEDSDQEQALDTGRNSPIDNQTDAMPPPSVPGQGSNTTENERDTTDNTEVSSASKKGKGKQRAVVLSDDEDDGTNLGDFSTNNDNSTAADSPAPVQSRKGGKKSIGGSKNTKENNAPDLPPPASTSSIPEAVPASTPIRSSFAHGNRAYTIASKQTKLTPMSELIRRVSSLPGSPFPTTSRPTYSPLVKGSKSVLRRIAPLHPNRRTPPPPPPKAPPPKKSKKMLELEEKWEMELEDTIEGWCAMSEGERATLRRQKRDHEMGYED